MAPTNALLGYGATAAIHDGSTVTDHTTIPASVFALIGEIREGPDDEDTADLVEVTNHQSDGKRREYIGALIDGGEVTLTCNYDPTDPTHFGADSLRNNIGATRYFQFAEPGNSLGMQVQCIITGVSRTRPVADAMQISFTLKKTGAEFAYTV